MEPYFLKIPYDNKQVVQEIRISGLLSKAPWFVNSNIQILLTWTDYSSQLVELANKLARQEKRVNKILEMRSIGEKLHNGWEYLIIGEK